MSLFASRSNRRYAILLWYGIMRTTGLCILCFRRDGKIQYFSVYLGFPGLSKNLPFVSMWSCFASLFAGIRINCFSVKRNNSFLNFYTITLIQYYFSITFDSDCNNMVSRTQVIFCCTFIFPGICFRNVYDFEGFSKIFKECSVGRQLFLLHPMDNRCRSERGKKQ